MDPSCTNHHQQEMSSSQTLESMLVCTNSQQAEKKPKPAEQGMKCPRCDSINTKFCYYNNYSLTQPRYFCKSCRRYWTKGGTLRNVPVGGGCRKNKRSSSKRAQENPTLPTNDSNPFLSSLVPTFSYDYSNDLSVAFAMLQQKQHNGHMGFDNDYEFPSMGKYANNNNPSDISSPLSGGNGLIDSLRSGYLEPPNGFENTIYRGNMSNNHHYWKNEQLQRMGLGINNAGESLAETGGLAYENTRTASSVVTSSVKQEGDQNNNRILWGFPWQINGSGDANMPTNADLDSLDKQRWNGLSSSTWQGLINSPLI